ncbi:MULTISPECIES: hypothetical protein [unclassified Mesorhizobium]|nr:MULTISPECIES: hypothetical protein [unclassified Mesorhizobium]
MVGGLAAALGRAFQQLNSATISGVPAPGVAVSDALNGSVLRVLQIR